MKTSMRSWSWSVGAAVVAAGAFLTWTAVEMRAQEQAPTKEQAEALTHARALSSAFRRVAEKQAPSVVAIHTKSKPKGPATQGRKKANPFKGTPYENLLPDEMFEGEATPRRQEEGLGSGVIIDKAGVVLTNRHVVEGADDVLVRLADGSEHKATDVRTDDQTDLAVVYIKTTRTLTPAVLGESGKLEIGDWVVAMGHPFGLEMTVTAGIISAKGRGLASGQGVNYLQTDAAINPGNSGGPLFDLEGRVIGINTAIASSSGGFQGVGFAIPSDTAKWVAQQLVKLMIQDGSPVKGSVITVLGFTFKEDVPDLRNTRVIDIIEELRDYGADVQIHDPCAHADEAHEEYGIRLTAEAELKPASAVVLAVPHRQYLAQGWSAVTNRLLNGCGVVADVKAKLDRATCPDGVSLWRL